MPLSVDFSIIQKLEGECRLNGYVPDPDYSQSGVTVASGFDLGARNLNDLKMIVIQGPLLDRLTPYLGLKGQSAVSQVNKRPLNTSDKECLAIDGAIKSHYINQISRKYNAALSWQAIRFENLPWQVQTVITSVAFQYGDLSLKAPRFWRAVTQQNWGEAEAILRDFKDRYKTRRIKEAELLSGAFK